MTTFGSQIECSIHCIEYNCKIEEKIVLSANLIHCLDPSIFLIFCRISNWNVLTIGGTAALIFYSLGPIFVFCSMGKVSREKKRSPFIKHQRLTHPPSYCYCFLYHPRRQALLSFLLYPFFLKLPKPKPNHWRSLTFNSIWRPFLVAFNVIKELGHFIGSL